MKSFRHAVLTALCAVVIGLSSIVAPVSAQGFPSWQTHEFNSADFYGSGSMTFTVDYGDVLFNRYVELGSTFIWNVQLNSVSTGGTRNWEHRITIPNGRTIAAGFNCKMGYLQVNGSSPIAGLVAGVSGNNYVSLYRYNLAVWDASAHNTHINFVCTFEVE